MTSYTIIIPTLNNYELNLKCVISILENTPPFKFEIIIIDNGSTDKTLLWARELHKQGTIRLLSNSHNMGFSHACNQGACTAKGEYLIFLNNDTEVLSGWIQSLHDCILVEKNAAVVGGKLLYPDNTVQHSGIAFDSKRVFHIYRHFHPLHPAVNKRREFQAVTGACFFVHKDVFITLGMFDECFINGFEDLDFCFRARKNGLKAFYTPDCQVIHHESKTPGRHVHHNQNAELFAYRWQKDIVHDLELIHQQDGLRQLQPGEMGLTGKWFQDSNPNFFWLKARSLRESGKIREAEDTYNNALRFNPFDLRRIDITEELGDLYLDQKNFHAAATCYEAIFAVYPILRIKKKLKVSRNACLQF